MLCYGDHAARIQIVHGRADATLRLVEHAGDHFCGARYFGVVQHLPDALREGRELDTGLGQRGRDLVHTVILSVTEL